MEEEIFHLFQIGQWARSFMDSMTPFSLIFNLIKGKAKPSGELL